MTDTIGGTRCKYCWRPFNYKWRPEEGSHNAGCPDASPEYKKEWDAGYAYGFADNNIPYWKQNTDFYSPAFLLGYRVGKAEIDQAVEEAVQANNNYSEWA